MATVSNVQLSVQHGGAGNRRMVTVSYTVCFNSCEVLAGSVFNERVTLRGDDGWPNPDDHLITIRSGCVKAQEGCIERRFTRSVSRSVLDEDGDTVILGWVVDANRDELYARVVLTPFVPSGSSADSNLVYGQWGAAGND